MRQKQLALEFGTFRNARESECRALAELRVTAMRPSLEAIGRFDPCRARKRFLAGFLAKDTWVVEKETRYTAVFVVRVRPDHLWLDHLYVAPDDQRQGLGQAIVRHVQQRAKGLACPVRLMALRDSPAARFYGSLGFVAERQEAFDIYFTWSPD